MSLVILSNHQFEALNNVDVIPRGLDRAFSFTNNLQTPLVIPPNSEVALESIKMNKDGIFSVGRSNSTMYQYIGKKLTDDFTFDESPRHPALIRVDPYGEYNAEDYVDNALIPNMNTGIYHPDLQGEANASVKRGTGNIFEGFNLTYDKKGSASGGNNRPTQSSSPTNQLDFVSGTRNSKGWEYTANNHRFHKRSGNGSENPRAFAEMSHMPLSCCQGNFQVAYQNATEWSVGLSRYCNPEAQHTDPDGTKVFRDFTDPPYYKRQGLGFYDYLACSVYNNASEIYELRLYHTVLGEGSLHLALKEVDYWNGDGSPVTEPYDLSGNASGFNHIKFTVDGEAVIVTLTKGAGATPAIICSPDYQDADNKSSYFKPVCQSCAYLYGKMEIRENITNDGQDEYLTVNKYDGREISGFNYDGYDTTKPNSLALYRRLTNHDWYATLVNLKRTKYLLDVDTRVFNDMDSQNHTFLKTSGGKIAYSVVPILSESKEYRPTLGANMSKVLGFDNYTVLDTPTSTNGSAVTFSSTVVPELVSFDSIFVRVNNLTQRSVNAVTGNQSQIIYHCPRFDNSGNETGGLFFSPGQKTYLDLNNAAPLSIGDFSIDLVDKTEQFVRSVVGSTVIVLHIRQKPKM